MTRKDWDLDERRPDLRFDVIVACNVFHYSPDPTRWFNNLTASCRAFLLTDLIRRKRSADHSLHALLADIDQGRTAKRRAIARLALRVAQPP